jgi:hypothetical protein
MENKIYWKITDPTVINGKVMCECVCGAIKMVNYNNLKRGNSKSCGCIRPQKELPILTEHRGYKKGDKINKLTIIDDPFYKLCPNGNNKFNNFIFFKCLCECGTIRECKASNVINGNLKSCGCTSLGQKVIGKIPRTFYRYLKLQAEKRKIDFSITFEEISDLYDEQNGLCALSGVPLEIPRVMRYNTRTASIDRIDSDKGYVKGNVQWVHVDINYAKLTLSNKDFIDMCRRVVEYNK